MGGTAVGCGLPKLDCLLSRGRRSPEKGSDFSFPSSVSEEPYYAISFNPRSIRRPSLGRYGTYRYRTRKIHIYPLRNSAFVVPSYLIGHFV
jgi:hypothetical protein